MSSSSAIHAIRPLVASAEIQARPRPNNLDALMARLAAGDRSAFEAVDHLLRPPIERLCRSLLFSQADADDATQNALEKILFRAPTYDPARPALPWALTIAGFECRTLLRKRQRRHEIAEVDENEQAGPDGEEVVIDFDQAEALHSAMAELSEHDRDILVRTFWKEEQPGPTDRKRKQRALERLRHLWKVLYGD